MLKDYFHYLLFTSSNILVSYFLLAFIANNLTKNDYATYGLLTTYFSLFLILTNLGHKDSLFKFSSMSNQTALKFWGKSSIFSVGCSVLLLLILSFWLSRNALWAGLSLITLHLLNLLSSIYRGKGNYKSDGLLIPSYRLLWLLVCWLMFIIFSDLNPTLVFQASFIAASIVFVIFGGVNVYRDFVKIKERYQFPLAEPTLRSFFLIELVTVSFMKVDIVILNMFSVDIKQIANYFFSLQLFEAGILVIAPVAYLVFNNLNKRQTKKLDIIIKGVLILLTTISIGAFVWWLVGEYFLLKLFPHYLGSYQIVFILILSLVPIGVNHILSHYLFSNHKEMAYVKISALGLLIIIVANRYFICFYGVIGAAYSRLLVEVVVLALLSAYCIATMRKVI